MFEAIGAWAARCPGVWARLAWQGKGAAPCSRPLPHTTTPAVQIRVDGVPRGGRATAAVRASSMSAERLVCERCTWTRPCSFTRGRNLRQGELPVGQSKCRCMSPARAGELGEQTRPEGPSDWAEEEKRDGAGLPGPGCPAGRRPLLSAAPLLEEPPQGSAAAGCMSRPAWAN